MESSLVMLIGSLVVFSGGGLIGYVARKRIAEGRVRTAERVAEDLIREAEREAEAKRKEVALELKESWYQSKAELEREVRDRRAELQKQERRITQKEENLDKKSDLLGRKEKDIERREKRILERESKITHYEQRYKSLVDEGVRKLEKISGMTSEEAKQELMIQTLSEARLEAAEKVKKIEDEAKENAKKKSKQIVALAIQRYAADYVAETTVSVVDLPNDEMKGRIIGREGRNIRALEIATGVDLIIDDTPEAVILSGYDPIKREITRLALERLIADGRIHPGRIEDVVEKVKNEMEIVIYEEGKQAAFEVGIDDLHPELIKLLGRLKYRTSYSQNVLQHAKEVAFLAGIMAAELGVDIKLAKRAGLLHDIGKAVTHQVEGSHGQIGVDLARKYNESEKVINAIASHHDDVEPTSIEAVLLQAADTVSAARPGARREMLETYVKRLEKLEEIGDSFKGVEKTYAIQAGREIRVIVRPEEIKDSEAVYLARDIARKIEKEMSYPGEIKVTVIRETRAIEYAK